MELVSVAGAPTVEDTPNLQPLRKDREEAIFHRDVVQNCAQQSSDKTLRTQFMPQWPTVEQKEMTNTCLPNVHRVWLIIGNTCKRTTDSLTRREAAPRRRCHPSLRTQTHPTAVAVASLRRRRGARCGSPVPWREARCGAPVPWRE
jgi:hypothetical protein